MGNKERTSKKERSAQTTAVKEEVTDSPTEEGLRTEKGYYRSFLHMLIKERVFVLTGVSEFTLSDIKQAG